MMFHWRRTKSLSSPPQYSTGEQQEIILFVLPSEEKVEVVTSDANQSNSDFTCCSDSCDLNSISSAFWILLGYDSESEDDDHVQTITTSLNQAAGPSLSLDLIALTSSSTSSATSDEMHVSNALSRSLSGIVQRLSLNLSKSSTRTRKQEAKTADCSRSDDEEIDENTHPLPISYMANIPSFSYTMEDDGEHGVGITPKSREHSTRYRMAAFDAATRKDFCALHEIFFQCLLDEAKARRSRTDLRMDNSSSNTGILETSKSYEDSTATKNETRASADFFDFGSLDEEQTLLNKPYPLSYETPSFPIPSFSSRNRNFFKLYSASTSTTGSSRNASSLRSPWYRHRFRRRDVARQEDLIIAPTSDFNNEDKINNKRGSESFHTRQKLNRIAPIFVHEHCRLQKDKYKGVNLGSAISAYGRDAVLQKINEKIDVIAAINLDDSRSVLTRVPACRMPLSSTRSCSINEDCKNGEWAIEPDESFQWGKKDVVETRSMIGVRMGLLSVQYGLLIHWDVGTFTADLIVLRKMCADDFIKKNHRISKSVSCQELPIQHKEVVETKLTAPYSSSSASSDRGQQTPVEMGKDVAEKSTSNLVPADPSNSQPIRQDYIDNRLMERVSLQVCVIRIEEPISCDSVGSAPHLHNPYVKLSCKDEVFSSSGCVKGINVFEWPLEYFTFSRIDWKGDESEGLTIEVYDRRLLGSGRLWYKLFVPLSFLDTSCSINSEHESGQDNQISSTEVTLPCKVMHGKADTKDVDPLGARMTISFLKRVLVTTAHT